MSIQIHNFLLIQAESIFVQCAWNTDSPLGFSIAPGQLFIGLIKIRQTIAPLFFCCIACRIGRLHQFISVLATTTNAHHAKAEADDELRSCANLWGVEKGDDWAKQLEVNRQEILGITRLTAELMYSAVRLGGAPCTGLPWRWGHGWPECQPGLSSIIE
ncbi:MAG: hypothetical protein ACI8XW_001026 [Gammaproteobacteria bacterium]|jgi:hypothetical protein